MIHWPLFFRSQQKPEPSPAAAPATVPTAAPAATVAAATPPPPPPLAPPNNDTFAAEPLNTAADVSARFGTSKSAVPALLADWKAAALDAGIEEAARGTLAPFMQRTLADAEASKGAPLQEEEIDALISDLEEQNLPAAIAAVRPQLDRDDATRAQVVANGLARHAPRVATLRDPFSPIAQGDPAARARETVLFETNNVMVLVDNFSPRPHALVIPKTSVSFPSDCPKALLDELANAAALVSDALRKSTGAATCETWINPPQYLTVKQLHVHVDPGLPRWNRALDEDVLAQQKSTFWQRVAGELAKI